MRLNCFSWVWILSEFRQIFPNYASLAFEGKMGTVMNKVHPQNWRKHLPCLSFPWHTIKTQLIINFLTKVKVCSIGKITGLFRSLEVTWSNTSPPLKKQGWLLTVDQLMWRKCLWHYQFEPQLGDRDLRSLLVAVLAKTVNIILNSDF